MEAGLEHLSRSGGTLAYADMLLVVMEPSRKSIVTAGRTCALAAELGIPHAFGLGNKVQRPDDADFFRKVCTEQGVPLAGLLPYEAGVVEADRAGRVVDERGTPLEAAIVKVIGFLDEVMTSPAGPGR